jgi:hypothetical protein
MKSSPTPPDPYQTAAAQTQSNIATAKANQETNMVDQTNPYGSLTYSQIGTNPDGTAKYQATTTLNPTQQGLLDQTNSNKGAALGVANQFVNGGQGVFSGKGPDLSYNGTTAALDALNRSRLDPQWEQNTNHQIDTLRNQGLTPGTPAYDNAMRVFNQGKNDAYNSANLADYQTSANAALQQWQAPLGAYSSLMSGGAPTNFTPMSTPTTNVPGTNIAGLVEQNYQQESQNANAYNGQMAGLFGTGASILAAPFTGGTSLAGLGGTMGGLFGTSSGVGNYGQTANAMGYGAGTGGQSFPMF